MADHLLYRGEAGTLTLSLDYDTAGELTGKTVAAKLALPGTATTALTLSATVTGSEDYALSADYSEAQSATLTESVYEYQLIATEGTDDTVLGSGMVVVCSRISDAA